MKPLAFPEISIQQFADTESLLASYRFTEFTNLGRFDAWANLVTNISVESPMVTEAQTHALQHTVQFLLEAYSTTNVATFLKFRVPTTEYVVNEVMLESRWNEVFPGRKRDGLRGEDAFREVWSKIHSGQGYLKSLAVSELRCRVEMVDSSSKLVRGLNVIVPEHGQMSYSLGVIHPTFIFDPEPLFKQSGSIPAAVVSIIGKALDDRPHALVFRFYWDASVEKWIPFWLVEAMVREGGIRPVF